MDLQLAGKKVVITGASKGIGFGCAVSLAQEGCDLHLVARNADLLNKSADEIRRDNPGVNVKVHSFDLSTSESQAALVEVTGIPDIWINNAGAIPGGNITDIDEQTWRNAWDLNVIGAAAVRPQPTYIAGAVGNSGLVGLTTALGSRSIQNGVRVLAVNPGLIVTDRMGDLLRQTAEAELGDPGRWEELIPSDPAPGTIEQCADVITFLVSPRASHVSGTTLNIDGGASAR